MATRFAGFVLNCCVLASVVVARAAQSNAPPPRVFAADSFWYTPIPDNAPLHPNSANLVTEFLRQKKAYYGTVSINTTAYASPVYVADAGTPTVRVAEWDCQKKKYTDRGLAEQWTAVPIPAYAEQADGTDAEMTIYQPSSDTIWEFWQARKVGDQWQACWGGRMQHASQSQGIWQKPYGTTATGLPFLGGQITAAELRRGKIEHVLGIALVDTETWKIVSWPANRSDGYNPKNAPNRIPEGLRFRLRPNRERRCGLSSTPSAGSLRGPRSRNTASSSGTKPEQFACVPENPKSYTKRGDPDSVSGAV